MLLKLFPLLSSLLLVAPSQANEDEAIFISPQQFETSVIILADALTTKGEDPEVIAEIQAFVMAQLEDEWISIIDNDETVEETFTGETLMERLVSTYQKLSPEEQVPLRESLLRDLRLMVTPSAPSPEEGPPPGEGPIPFPDWVKESWGDGGNGPAPTPNKNGKSLREKAGTLIDQMDPNATEPKRGRFKWWF